MSIAALKRFQRSMQIGYAEWHDGIGYSLDALDAMTPEERLVAENLVLDQHFDDWRDVEALDHIGSTRALAELKKAASAKPLEVRIEAAARLARRKLLSRAKIEEIIVGALDETTLLNGMVKTLDFAASHPTAAVKAKLLKCAREGNSNIRVHAAALVHFLHGGASRAFDVKHRPFYLKFASKDRKTRQAAYLELCEKIGVDPHAR
jgi:hypothetical protein